MHLVVKRSQADVKGMLGGHKGVQFNLFYRLVLTEEEAALVTRYNLGAHVLTRSQVKIDTVRDATQGVTESLQSVEVLIQNERVVKEACDAFYRLVTVARTFGGEEIVKLPLDAA